MSDMTKQDALLVHYHGDVRDAMDEEMVQQYHRSARAERVSAFDMSPDLPLHDTPCATCKHARWDKPDYGLCDHPTSVAYRNRPMVVLPAERRLGYIRRQTYFSGLVCNAAWPEVGDA